MIKIKAQLELFFIALSFYSRIPIPRWVSFEHRKLHQCGRYFPLVGWVLAGGFLFVYWALSSIFVPQLALIGAMGSAIWLSGAFHEDGFADFCDGFGGGYSKRQILHIMKDSRLGTYGAVGLILLLLCRFVALSQFTQLSVLIWVIWCGFSVSRFFAYSFFIDMDYVRDDPNAKAKSMVVKSSKQELLMAAVFGLAPLCYFSSAQAITILVALFVVRTLFKRYLFKQIGGYTGDCLGAAQQLFELMIYLILGATVWNFI